MRQATVRPDEAKCVLASIPLQSLVLLKEESVQEQIKKKDSIVQLRNNVLEQIDIFTMLPKLNVFCVIDLPLFNRSTGSLILIDKKTNETLAAGLIIS